MTRKSANGLLKEFVQYTQPTEIPSLYALWCAISAISATMGRDCFIDMGHYTIYPNMFIVLVAGSGKCKKSTSIGVTEFFLSKLERAPRMFSQKATPEALIGSLSGMTCDDSQEGKISITPSAEGIIIADELSTLIDKTSTQSGMVQFLTTLWDSKSSFTYSTRSRGKETIENACVSLLGGSTIDWIKEAISLTAIGGGFTARMVFVYRDSYEKLVLRTKRTPEQKAQEDNIIHDLNEISHLRGEFIPTTEAWEILEAEYVDFMKNSPMHDNKYLSGYANKRSTNLFKLCIVVSASRKDDKVIDDADVKVAIKILKFVEQYMPKVMMAIASDDIGVANAYITEIIKAKGVIDRKLLLNMVHHRMQATELDSILDTLEQAGIVTRTVHGRKEAITYIADESTKVSKKDELSFTEMILKGSKS